MEHKGMEVDNAVSEYLTNFPAQHCYKASEWHWQTPQKQGSLSGERKGGRRSTGIQFLKPQSFMRTQNASP